MRQFVCWCLKLVCPNLPNPPRPRACKRVDVVTQQQTLQTSQNLQTNLLGGGFTLPLPPPRPLGSDNLSRLWRLRGPLDPSTKTYKNPYKINIFAFWPQQAPTCTHHMPKMVPEWPKSGPKPPLYTRNDPKVTPKWPQSDAKVTPQWSKIYLKSN